MNGIQFSSLLALIAGVTILIFPDILAILLAIILIIFGINGLIFGSKIKNTWKIKIDK